MDFGSSTVMQMAKTAMRYNMQRQTQLSHNIANLDTPNYKAHDLKQLDFAAMAEQESGRLELRSTAPTHMPGFSSFGKEFGEQATRDTFETTPMGNNVVLEQQMAQVNETGLKYQLATNVYHKMQTLFKIALGSKG